MKLFSKILQKTGFVTRDHLQQIKKHAFIRGFTAAKQDRLTASWNTQLLTMDQILKMELRLLKSRSRDLARNNDYARRFIALLKTNVIGPDGFSFQSRVKDPNGKFDKVANQIIEDAWKEWIKPKNASVSQRQSFRALQWLLISSIAIDGEAIFRKVRNYDNKFRFALQPIDSVLLDESVNTVLKNGHEIRMGIEFDQWQRPIAYYFRKRTPDGYGYYSSDHEIIPADQILHIFIQENVSQVRGVPPMCAAIEKMHNIGAYTEAEIYAARAQASKMGFYEQDEFSDLQFEENAIGELITDMEPGHIEFLPKGLHFKEWNPTHPTGNFGTFVRETLRSMACGLNISYHIFGNDLERVNYSSARIGSLDDRDWYKFLQALIIDEFNIWVFEDWLKMSILSGAIPLPFHKLEKFNQPHFQGRRWDWVDPLKEVQANKEARRFGFKTHSEILADRGRDFIDVLDQLAWEEEEIKKRGLKFNEVMAAINEEEIEENETNTDD